MKSILTLPAFLLFLFSSVYLNAQITTASQWGWMKGDSTINSPGVYGTQGVAAAANKPGARSSSSTWKDASGNLWLFGGDFNNDLWKYNPSTNQWTWINGANTPRQSGTYGTMGIPSAFNKPGGRSYAVSWTDAAGNFWLFGGYGLDGNNGYGNLNDLWKYNPSTNQWTWINGANTRDQSGIYGTQGIPASANRPGGRYASASWTDASGNLWLYGGGTASSFGEIDAPINDLWKYNPSTNQWTWINGASTTGQPGIYGTQGVPAASNQPGARELNVSWTDAAGNFWLFGGYGVVSGGNLNDLWKYSPSTNQWTWVNGSNIGGQPGIYGTRGVPAVSNQPGGRSKDASWTDASGNFWLFGGEGVAIAANNSGTLNDLWKYNPSTNQWVWINGANTIDQPSVYGTIGIPASANRPGAKAGAVSWTDASGNFWLFGGDGNYSKNDLWRFGDTSSLQFSPSLTINDVSHNEGNSGTTTYTFTVSLSSPAPAGGVTFNIATADGTATAGSDYIAKSLTGQTIAAGSSTYTFDVQVNGDVVVEPNETFFVNVTNVTGAVVSDGQGLGTIVNDDLNDSITTSSQWTWMKGSNTSNAPGVYGAKGIPSAANMPGTRYGSVSWTDAAGNFWLFGGRIFINGGDAMLNDLWKYNPVTNQWTWINGDSTGNQPGIYGTLGTAAATNTPSARAFGTGWTDAIGNLWLFGGLFGSVGDLNDLWKYNPSLNQWTWINGASTVYQQGVYGTKGIPDPANRPGARSGSVSWADLAGNLWLFGGSSYNDLWRYNLATNQWTWMNGSNFGSQQGVYGTLRVPSSSNTPGERLYSFTWTDAAGKFWLFGGIQSNGTSFFNDLWKYDPATNQWAWINGANILNQQGVYGTLGTAATSNTPGARYAGVKWIDAAGSLWLFGGYGYVASINSGWLNDLWKYDPATNRWTWINGASTVNQQNVYGTQGTPAATNRPSARAFSTGWIDTSGNFWIFSGNGTSLNSDLWRLGNAGISFESVNNGNWNNPSTWVGGVVPSASSIVIIRHNITVQANASCYSLRIEGPNGFVRVAPGIQFSVLH